VAIPSGLSDNDCMTTEPVGDNIAQWLSDNRIPVVGPDIGLAMVAQMKEIQGKGALPPNVQTYVDACKLFLMVWMQHQDFYVQELEALINCEQSIV